MLNCACVVWLDWMPSNLMNAFWTFLILKLFAYLLRMDCGVTGEAGSEELVRNNREWMSPPLTD